MMVMGVMRSPMVKMFLLYTYFTLPCQAQVFQYWGDRVSIFALGTVPINNLNILTYVGFINVG